MLIAIALTIIIWVLVAIAMKRFPFQGWTPAMVGSVFNLVAFLFAWWYFRRLWYFARYGVQVTAKVVALLDPGRYVRKAVFKYQFDGAEHKFILDNALFAFKDGYEMLILVDPRYPFRWIRHDQIFGRPPADQA